ncbi:MAG: hypothetical protein KC777_27570 [Cyanobacteria bacterium HKST-UBA02]|nr:hypothetical protein [Cyanobacteria bacterium HKST-UBA02]
MYLSESASGISPVTEAAAEKDRLAATKDDPSAGTLSHAGNDGDRTTLLDNARSAYTRQSEPDFLNTYTGDLYARNTTAQPVSEGGDGGTNGGNSTPTQQEQLPRQAKPGDTPADAASEQARKDDSGTPVDLTPRREVDQQMVQHAAEELHKLNNDPDASMEDYRTILQGTTEAERREIEHTYHEKFDGTFKSDATRFRSEADRDEIYAMTEAKDVLDLGNERTHMLDGATEHLSGDELRAFKDNFVKFEERAARDGLSRDEIAKTFRETSRLLDARGDSPLTEKDRIRLASEVMKQAAEPTSIDQGHHNTCNVTTVEVRLYQRNPSDAARVVADTALTGHYTDGYGFHSAAIDPEPHDESKTYPPQDGQRTHASELFQVAAINLFYDRERDVGSTNYRYEQREPTGPGDTGERLLDMSKKPPAEVLKPDGKPADSPNLYAGDLLEIDQAITGRYKDGAVITNEHYSSNNRDFYTTKIKSPEELESRLAEFKATGNMPVILLVNSQLEPINLDPNRASSDSGAHVVNITDYKPGPPPKFHVDNQWGSLSDRLVEDLSLEDLYTATLPTGDAITRMQGRVDSARESGQADFALEGKLLQLRHRQGLVSDEQFATDSASIVDRALRQNSPATPLDRYATSRVERLAQDLPTSQALDYLDRMYDAGLIDDINLVGDLIGMASKIETAKKLKGTSASESEQTAFSHDLDLIARRGESLPADMRNIWDDYLRRFAGPDKT